MKRSSIKVAVQFEHLAMPGGEALWGIEGMKGMYGQVPANHPAVKNAMACLWSVARDGSRSEVVYLLPYLRGEEELAECGFQPPTINQPPDEVIYSPTIAHAASMRRETGTGAPAETPVSPKLETPPVQPAAVTNGDPKPKRQRRKQVFQEMPAAPARDEPCPVVDDDTLPLGVGNLFGDMEPDMALERIKERL